MNTITPPPHGGKPHSANSQWRHSLPFGEYWEQVFRKLFMAEPPALIVRNVFATATIAHSDPLDFVERSRYDIACSFPNSGFSVEVKTYRTECAFLEIASGDKPSGLAVSTADYWGHVWPKHREAIVTTTDILRQIIEGREVKPAAEKSHGVYVPRWLIAKHAIARYQIPDSAYVGLPESWL